MVRFARPRFLVRAAAALGITLALSGCGVAVRAVTGERIEAPGSESEAPALPAPRPLTGEERGWATAAWRYFAVNSDAGTGLPFSVEGFASSTMWEAGDALAALVSARELGLIQPAEFDRRAGALIGTLGRLDLAYGKMPNKTYDARTGKPTGGAAPGWAGWSAVDLGRLLVWLRIVADRYPAHAQAAAAAVGRFDLCAAIGTERGLYATGGDTAEAARYRESLRGYEEYAANGFRLWGIVAGPPPATSGLVQAGGVPFATRAEPGRGQGDAPVLTGPSVLSGLEFGWRAPSGGSQGVLADRVVRAQAARREQTGQATARNDYLRGSTPYFLYGTVAARGRPWVTELPDGSERGDLDLVSTRAAFQLWAVRPDLHAGTLDSLKGAADPSRGWPEGRYERTGEIEKVLSASTNAMVLEALAFRTLGPLLPKPLDGAPQERCGMP